MAEEGTVQERQVNMSQESLMAWIEANRHMPELTCEQRIQYGVEPLCGEASTPAVDEP